MQDPLLHKIINPFSRLKGGIHLNQGLRPEKTISQFPFHIFTDLGVKDMNEALNVVAVVLNKPVTQRKDVHGNTFLFEKSGQTKEPLFVIRNRA
jgi:hypothetical protein